MMLTNHQTPVDVTEPDELKSRLRRVESQNAALRQELDRASQTVAGLLERTREAEARRDAQEAALRVVIADRRELAERDPRVVSATADAADVLLGELADEREARALADKRAHEVAAERDRLAAQVDDALLRLRALQSDPDAPPGRGPS